MSNIKLIATTSTKSIFRWLSIFIPGFSLGMIFFIVSLFLLYDSGDGGHATHTGSFMSLILEFLRLAITDPFPFALCVMSVAMIPLSYIMATKFSLNAAFYDIWNGSLKEWFFAKIIDYVEIAKSNSNILNSTDNFVTNKVRIIQAIREDEESSSFQKKLLTFIMKKIFLEDADFSDPNVKYSDIIIKRLELTAHELSYPSRVNVYYLYLFHFILLVLALVFNNS